MQKEVCRVVVGMCACTFNADEVTAVLLAAERRAAMMRTDARILTAAVRVARMGKIVLMIAALVCNHEVVCTCPRIVLALVEEVSKKLHNHRVVFMEAYISLCSFLWL